MTYTPDPVLVRTIATRIIGSEIDSIRDLGAMDIGEMCETEIEALHESDMATHEAHDATDILIEAVRKEIQGAAIVGSTVWTGYDDEERGFPLFDNLPAAQQYAEHRFREDAEAWGNDTSDLEIAWAERKAYTDAHNGRAGMYDLITEVGSDGYVVHELTIYRNASDAIRDDNKRDAVHTAAIRES